jgi:glycosyltransferase involved in cell wall biosynthesis
MELDKKLIDTKHKSILFLAVWMVTYDHEKYIAQAIESVINQKTTFPIRLYIGEDCSTDRTKEICIYYKNKFPHLIELIFTAENNMSQNSKNVYETCFKSGAKYIALLEGDDYWTDPYKLQKQVDFLESNPDFVICYHDVEKIFDDDCVDAEVIAKEDNRSEISDIYDLAEGNFIYTPSCVFRNILDPLPDWFFESAIGDWLLYLLLTEHGGKIYHIKEKMAAYRIHNGGFFSTNNSMDYSKQYKINKRLADQLETQIKYFNSNTSITSAFKRKLFLSLNKLRLLALRNRDYKTARQTSLKMINLISRRIPEFKMALSLFFSAWLPRTYSNYLMGKKQFSD